MPLKPSPQAGPPAQDLACGQDDRLLV